MRTTLEIDDTVLAAARSFAKARGTSVGAALSELARRGLEARAVREMDVAYSPFPVLVGNPEHIVSDDLVAEHRDD